MKKNIINLILYIAMFVFSGIAILLACRNSNQAIMPSPWFIDFEGEYSQGNGDWQPLCEESDFSAYDGDLILRGRFPSELPEGARLNFYLNHIGISMYINGELIFDSSYEKYPDMCGSIWEAWDYVSASEGDVFEIHLHNPHLYGNGNAYNEFLDSVSMIDDLLLKTYYDKQALLYRGFCVFIFVASIALIGTAIGYQLLRLPSSTLLLKLGIMSLLMDAYMFFDAKNIHMHSDSIMLNTYARQLAIMLSAWMMVNCIAELLQAKRRKLAEIAGYALMLADSVFIALSIAGVMRIYDTGIYWAIIQGIVSMVLLILCVAEQKSRGERNRFLAAAVLSLVAFMAELLNARISRWQSGVCIKTVFGILFILLLINAVRVVAKNYQNSINAKKLREELKNSRAILATSQIRTHFIFNILNTISGMCGYDPQKADETLVMFSRYLRNNINIMEEDEPETFTKSLKHLEDYIRLEQVRFGEKIQFEECIEANDFMIPPLVLQPIVENAIKHGLLRKKQGGTIRLHTWKEDGNSIIEIADDGVGFDTKATRKEGAVGMENVRFRLKYMAGGTMDVKSCPGAGTTVTIMIPGDEKMR